MTTRQTAAALCALTAAALTSTLLITSAGAASHEPTADEVRIHDVQGSTRISPLAGEEVREVAGIVTGVRGEGSRGFWIQDEEPDDDPATSEGVFVYTGKEAPAVLVGDRVRVSGTVAEYRPDGEDSGNQSLTQITAPEVTVDSSGNELPDPVRLDARRIPRAYAPKGGGEGGVEDRELRPRAFALDLYESLEGMNVEVRDSRVVGPSTSYGELWVTVTPRENPSARGGSVYGSYRDQNAGRLKIKSLADPDENPFPAADTGDRLTGRTEGPLDYDEFGGYTLAAAELGKVERRGLERERTRPQRRDELAVATYNVENLHPGNDAEKFERLARGIARDLAAPDIVALEEIQDNNGPEDDGETAADRTLETLIEAIVDAGGPRYEWRGIDPEDKADGGEPGGNIRTAFLFNPERVTAEDRPGGDATTPTAVERRDGRASLTLSPGRVDPADEAWEDSRKPLAAQFAFRGEPVIVVANHFSSKGGDEPLHGRFQPPNRVSETQRLAQAESVNSFVRDALKIDRKAQIVVLGDINDFEFSGTTKALTAGGALRSTAYALPRDERYTYVFQGNSQILDQTLVSPAIRRYDYDIVHTNAEFADQISDHDPQVLRFRP
ncbi:endonuclease/exonuclease/phosphatase family protein [Streptomyces tardus]|uniref:endonuclease/exonuclease/phosphatase family protein n=1 Tax=Streptomyces tardus TaxID=2780544 RepID=UPI001F3A0AFD|nr:endonuclease/exonuclease/phosphatase family protein [Streptomyces tardus]